MEKVAHCVVIDRCRTSSRPGNPLALNRLLLCGISVPFAQATPVQPSEWTGYTHILILAAVLCLIAVIVLTVPAIFDYLRHWRQNRQMYSFLNRNSATDETPSEASEKVASIIDTDSPTRDALGWSPEDRTQGKSATQDRLADRGLVSGPKKTIMIADDDPVVAMALARRLRQMGYNVLRSPDAAHALLGAMKVRPDLVILDVNMPAGNGLAVCEMMASDPRYSSIPVVIHSVIGDEATKQRCKQLGAYHVDKSPQSWGAIKNLVETLLNANEAKADSEPAIVQPDFDASWAAEVAQRRGDRGPESTQKGTVAATEEPPGVQKPAQVQSQASLPTTPATCGSPRVLCIESPKDRLEFVERQLSALGIEVTRTSDLEEGFWTCFTEKPQVVIIQASQSKKALQGLLERLSQHPVTRTLPVLLIDEGNVISSTGSPVAVSLRVLTFPMDWEDLLGELEAILPIFGRREGEGVLMKIADSTAAEGTVAEDMPVVAAGPSAGSDGEERPLSVLCIDDDPVVARSIAIRLQPYGITVISANNGTQGHLMAVTEEPDLILLDLKMPKGEGNYVLSKLKEGDRTEHIPVIILTIESNPGVRRQLMSMGAAAFLSKPIRWAQLFEEMARCVKLPPQLLADYRISRPLTLAEL